MVRSSCSGPGMALRPRGVPCSPSDPRSSLERRTVPGASRDSGPAEMPPTARSGSLRKSALEAGAVSAQGAERDNASAGTASLGCCEEEPLQQRRWARVAASLQARHVVSKAHHVANAHGSKAHAAARHESAEAPAPQPEIFSAREEGQQKLKGPSASQNGPRRPAPSGSRGSRHSKTEEPPSPLKRAPRTSPLPRTSPNKEMKKKRRSPGKMKAQRARRSSYHPSPCILEEESVVMRVPTGTLSESKRVPGESLSRCPSGASTASNRSRSFGRSGSFFRTTSSSSFRSGRTCIVAGSECWESRDWSFPEEEQGVAGEEVDSAYGAASSAKNKSSGKKHGEMPQAQSKKGARPTLRSHVSAWVRGFAGWLRPPVLDHPDEKVPGPSSQAGMSGGKAGAGSRSSSEQARQPEQAHGSLVSRPLKHSVTVDLRSEFSRQLGVFRGQTGFFESYSLGKVLGEGGYGTVRKCLHLQSGRAFACKVVEKGQLRRPKDLVQARAEYLLHSWVGGQEGVLAVEHLYEDEGRLYLVMQLCEAGDLFDLVNSVEGIPEVQAAGIMMQLVQALALCHEQGIVHRDIKLENILVADPVSICNKWKAAGFKGTAEVPTVLLADFGAARLLFKGDKVVGQTGGSMMYQSPELLSGDKYDFKADMWALGVVLFALLSGCFPFTAPSPALLPGMIRRGLFSFATPRWDSVSDEAKDLVQRLLEVDPDRRPTAKGVSLHPWLMAQS